MASAASTWRACAKGNYSARKRLSEVWAIDASPELYSCPKRKAKPSLRPSAR